LFSRRFEYFPKGQAFSPASQACHALDGSVIVLRVGELGCI
jgi:hypothetical protein